MTFVFGGKVERGAVPGVEARGRLLTATGRGGLQGASGIFRTGPGLRGRGAGKWGERGSATLVRDGG